MYVIRVRMLNDNGNIEKFFVAPGGFLVADFMGAAKYSSRSYADGVSSDLEDVYRNYLDSEVLKLSE